MEEVTCPHLICCSKLIGSSISLFREHDRQSMKPAFDLWSHDDVALNSEAILGRLREGTMPCDGAWPDEQVALFQGWVEGGTPA